MPHQQFDENMDRVACQRRCEEDDQWLNPHPNQWNALHRTNLDQQHNDAESDGLQDGDGFDQR